LPSDTPNGGYRIARFAEAPEVSADDVLSLWRAEGALPEAEARTRVAEVAFVGVDGAGALVAVSTAYLAPNAQLRAQVWHCRAFVAGAHRESDIATRLVRETRRHLEGRFVSGEDPRAPGILMEVENPLLKRFANQAVWARPISPGVGWTFIGENQRGDHLRVYWFPGARAPGP
jgi:hypothetical protein